MFNLETTNTHIHSQTKHSNCNQHQIYSEKSEKTYIPCSVVLLSCLGSVGGGGAGGSSEQLPGERNSRTTLSTWGLKIWLILGSTTWATILSTPCSSIPDLHVVHIKKSYNKCSVILDITFTLVSLTEAQVVGCCFSAGSYLNGGSKCG